MHNYKKAIVALDGTSSKINCKEILINIRYALNALQLPFEVYKSHSDGFNKLREDMNQEDTLYIVNDSLQFHLCDKPNIIISRSTPWVQATPKPYTIGVFSQEMIAHEASQLIACIARNKPVRQHNDLSAATTYILTNEYQTNDTSTMGRYGIAAFSWSNLISNDIHAKLLLHFSDGWPTLNTMLQEGIECFSHPDDLLIIINRDICLIPEATAIIRNYMDTNNIDACYAKRVDCVFDGLLKFNQIKDLPVYEGLDLFVFRPSAQCIAELINVPLKLGRVAWDNFWADRVKNKLPYNVCYHFPHAANWSVSTSAFDGNKENLLTIEKHSAQNYMGIEEYEEYFKDVK
jgi:hypothetical protein